jgi:MEKHLA domain
MPSRLTAEPTHRDERRRLLERTGQQGFIDNYSGIRVSVKGKRFQIEGAILWNLIDAMDERVGQAAMFERCRFL